MTKKGAIMNTNQSSYDAKIAYNSVFDDIIQIERRIALEKGSCE